jgi:hypothetical protein
MDLGLLVVSLYVTIDDWWEEKRPAVIHGPGRTVLLSESEVLTLAVLVQWPRLLEVYVLGAPATH